MWIPLSHTSKLGTKGFALTHLCRHLSGLLSLSSVLQRNHTPDNQEPGPSGQLMFKMCDGGFVLATHTYQIQSNQLSRTYRVCLAFKGSCVKHNLHKTWRINCTTL